MIFSVNGTYLKYNCFLELNNLDESLSISQYMLVADNYSYLSMTSFVASDFDQLGLFDMNYMSSHSAMANIAIAKKKNFE